MTTLHLQIPGEPIAKARPKTSTANGFVRSYTPKKTREYERKVKHLAREAMVAAGLTVTDQPVRAELDFYWPLPASAHRKRKPVPQSVRPKLPDGDNVMKAILDGMNGEVYRDDAQVVAASFRKWTAAQGEEPRVEVSLSWGAVG